MPATIDALLRGKPDLVTTRADATVKDVLAELVKYDYSQLPVIDNDGKPVGLVTGDSIVRALHTFGVTTSALFVKDAMVRKPATYYASDDVFDAFDDLETDEVVLVIDEQGKLIGIVTTYDTTAYLRQRAQDIMVVQEVEEMIKSYTNAAFTTPSGDIDKQKQHDAIAAITPSNSSQKGKFQKALQHYLKACGEASPKLNQAALDAAFTAHLYDKPSVKPFEKLTLGEYINLFMHPNRWPVYSPVFAIDREAILRLLNAVRQTRNALAHFRDDISPQEREELRFCKEWLSRHEKAINLVFGAVNGAAVSPSPADGQGTSEVAAPTTNGALPLSTPTETPNSTSTDISSAPVDGTAPSGADQDETGPIDEVPTAFTGRYVPLVRHLIEQPARAEKVTLTFDEIDALLGEHQLPESARKYRAWWANDSVSHAHSQQWLEAGWRVANINMTEARVTFARITDNQQALLQFFNTLQVELEQRAPGVFHLASSGGLYFLTLDVVRAGVKRVGSFYCSFTRTRRIRIELFIDTYSQETSKQLFGALVERKEAIEAEVGDRLSWEPMVENRGSRIARYYPGTITDTAGSLANLRARIVEAATRFVPVLRRELVEAIPSVLGIEVNQRPAERTS